MFIFLLSSQVSSIMIATKLLRVFMHTQFICILAYHHVLAIAVL